MTNDLFQFQKEGVDWLAPRRTALLADEMGLGKSAQAITASDRVGAKRVLVICPAVARINWGREFGKWSTIHRQQSICLSNKTSPVGDLVVCSYEYATSQLERLKQQPTFDALIVDEAHYLKSIDAKRSKAISGREGLVHHARRVWMLTGTPAPNDASELWIICYIFGATKLRREAFIRSYCLTEDTIHGLKVVGNRPEKLAELRTILKTFTLMRRKADVMKQLPKISFYDIAVEPGEVDFDLNQNFTPYIFPRDRRDELQTKLKEQEALITAVVKTTKMDGHTSSEKSFLALQGLAKSVSTLRRWNGCQKINPVVDLLTAELESGALKKIVLFAVHQDVIQNLRIRLSKFGAVTLYGNTDPANRQHNIDRFQNRENCRVFVGQIQACGTAINLTAASEVMFVEQSWVPAENAQAAMRVHRIGQTQPVRVRVVSIADSIDERINQSLRRKTRQLAEIFDEVAEPPSSPLEKLDLNDAFRKEKIGG